MPLVINTKNDKKTESKQERISILNLMKKKISFSDNVKEDLEPFFISHNPPTI
jgi:hypothetical protein